MKILIKGAFRQMYK